MAFSACSRIQG
ncbi:hypothetical protein D046_8198A, partial [Vibrio parahaemolyticus V-223/04]